MIREHDKKESKRYILRKIQNRLWITPSKQLCIFLQLHENI